MPNQMLLRQDPRWWSIILHLYLSPLELLSWFSPHPGIWTAWCPPCLVLRYPSWPASCPPSLNWRSTSLINCWPNSLNCRPSLYNWSPRSRIFTSFPCFNRLSSPITTWHELHVANKDIPWQVAASSAAWIWWNIGKPSTNFPVLAWTKEEKEWAAMWQVLDHFLFLSREFSKVLAMNFIIQVPNM